MSQNRLSVHVEHVGGHKMNFESDSPLSASEAWAALMALDHVVEASVKDITKRKRRKAGESPYGVVQHESVQNDRLSHEIGHFSHESGPNQSLLVPKLA